MRTPFFLEEGGQTLLHPCYSWEAPLVHPSAISAFDVFLLEVGCACMWVICLKTCCYTARFMLEVGEETLHVTSSVGEGTEVQNYQQGNTIKLNWNVFLLLIKTALNVTKYKKNSSLPGWELLRSVDVCQVFDSILFFSVWQAKDRTKMLAMKVILSCPTFQDCWKGNRSITVVSKPVSEFLW